MVTMPQPKPATEEEQVLDFIPLDRFVKLLSVDEDKVNDKIREWCLTKMREEGIDV